MIGVTYIGAGSHGLTPGQAYTATELMEGPAGQGPMCLVNGLWQLQADFEPAPSAPAIRQEAPVAEFHAPIQFTPITEWSYSRWADYDRCPFYFKKKHIDKIKEPKSAAQDKGILYHDNMANYLLAKPGAVCPPTKFGALMAELREFPDKIVEEKMGFTSAWQPTGYFTKGDNATWLRATWDVGLMYEDLTGEVCDHKTGKMYGSNAEQMELFALTFFCKFKPATHVTTRLWYHEHGDEDVMEFEAAQVPAMKKKWEKRAQTMMGDRVYAMRPNDKCKWCMHAKSAGGVCRFG